MDILPGSMLRATTDWSIDTIRVRKQLSVLNKKIIFLTKFVNQIIFHHFRNYKNAETILERSRSGFNSMSAAVIFIPDQSEVTHIETPDYRKLSFLRFEVPIKNFDSSFGSVLVRCGWSSRIGAWFEFDDHIGHV